MPTAEARVATGQAARYLAQLCGHLDAIHNRHRARHSGSDTPQIRTVSETDNTGLLEFDRGTCTLEATSDALILSVDAINPESLKQITTALTHRLEAIGHREGLTLTW
jgi:hypothetical protein